MSVLTVSVAMATCNGAKYIREQLYSLNSQSLLPDELIVVDDRSTDDTVLIVRRFSEVAKFKVKVYENACRLGASLNFSRAISECSCDLIFMADQDDIWLPNKIEHIKDMFSSDLDLAVLVCDAEFIDADGHSLGITKMRLLQKLGSDKKLMTMGCCTAMRLNAISHIMPIPNIGIAHDIWIHNLARYSVKTAHVSLVLQKYRRHDTNVSGGAESEISRSPRLNSLWRRLRKFTHGSGYSFSKGQEQYYVEAIARLRKVIETPDKLTYIDRRLAANGVEILNRQRKGRELRDRLLSENQFKRIIPIYQLWRFGGYNQFSGALSAVRDVLTRSNNARK